MMAYSHSSLDVKLQRWFKSDDTCSTLHGITLSGRLRSLNNVEIKFNYPISAFAGKNGCGKTTVLALAACAYHNDPKGFKMKSRKRNYYTFSDFFIQTHEEIKPEGVTVSYEFLFNEWGNLDPGLGIQSMRKREGGKWTNYEKRIEKNVVYLGIDRVVPQTERTVYKSYKKFFIAGEDTGWYQEVQRYVGQILGKKYSDFKITKAGSYNMQVVKETEIIYSGFNMGAGEKALFELFSFIYECAAIGKASLIIIDEIELGLHEVAQRKLIEILKEICQKKRLQIICTTHSPAILESLPPSARFYIDKDGDETVITEGISGEFAAGRLADNHSNELDIYVEDTLAESILKRDFNIELRQRVKIIPVGSFSAVCRQMASAYRHPKLKNKSIAIFDGDQRHQRDSLIDKIRKDLELATEAEKTKFSEWVKNKINFLPGNENPEKWILRKALTLVDKTFADQLGVRVNFLKTQIELALLEETHNEFYFLSQKLSLNADSILADLTSLIITKEGAEIDTITQTINKILNSRSY